MIISTATHTDVKDSAPQLAVLPVGSFEQHGHHLPLSTDTLIACAIARRLADDHGLFPLPPVTISCSHEHAAFAGTVSIRAATLIVMIEDVTASLHASGIIKLALINGHGGNYVLSNIVQQAHAMHPLSMLLFPTPRNGPPPAKPLGP